MRLMTLRATLCAINIAGAKLGQQKVVATEYIERQKTFMIVIAMEKRPNLRPMGFDIGRINIKNDMIRGAVMGL